MITSFDTSAINRLHEDVDREAILAGLRAAGSFRVSAINVVELSATSDRDLRHRLVHFASQLADGIRPLTYPNSLVRASIAAFARRDPSYRVSVEGEDDEVWWALENPDDIDDEAAGRIVELHRRREADLSEPMRVGRAQYEAIFRGNRWPRTDAEAIRGILSGREIYRESLSEIFERAAGRPPGARELEYLWETIPIWRLYLMAWAYGVCARGMRPQDHSLSRNAGIVDLTSACYLSLCSTFVTNDYRQYLALRLLSRFTDPPGCTVTLYDRIRRRLVLPNAAGQAP